MAQQQAAVSTAEKSEELQHAAERLATQNAELQQATAELGEKRQAVQRRADHVDQCRAALEQLRGELECIHRETLEIRLATEELWVRLSGAAPPAALVRSLGQIRAKLACQYRQAAAELAEQKKELEAIRGELNTQHEKLVEHKLRLEQWAVERQEECETASGVVGRARRRTPARGDLASRAVAALAGGAGRFPARTPPLAGKATMNSVVALAAALGR